MNKLEAKTSRAKTIYTPYMNSLVINVNNTQSIISRLWAYGELVILQLVNAFRVRVFRGVAEHSDV